MSTVEFDDPIAEITDFERRELENPLFGYLVIAVAVLAGMLSASVMGHSPFVDSTFPKTPSEAVLAAPTNLDSTLNAVLPLMEKSIETSEPSASSPRRWILGVRVQPTHAGCVVTEVIQGSAAEQANLNAGDRILAIDGQQIGWVGKKQIPLHRVIDQLVHPKNELLVQRHSGGQIASLPIRLKTIGDTLGN